MAQQNFAGLHPNRRLAGSSPYICQTSAALQGVLMEYIITSAFVALFIAAVFYFPWLRSRERRRLLEALLLASEKGHVPPAELLQPLIGAVTGSSPTPQS